MKRFEWFLKTFQKICQNVPKTCSLVFSLFKMSIRSRRGRLIAMSKNDSAVANNHILLFCGTISLFFSSFLFFFAHWPLIAKGMVGPSPRSPHGATFIFLGERHRPSNNRQSSAHLVEAGWWRCGKLAWAFRDLRIQICQAWIWEVVLRRLNQMQHRDASKTSSFAYVN